MTLLLLQQDLATTADSFEFHLRSCQVCLFEGEALCTEGRFFQDDAQEIRTAVAAYRWSEDRAQFAAAVTRRRYPTGVSA